MEMCCFRFQLVLHLRWRRYSMPFLTQRVPVSLECSMTGLVQRWGMSCTLTTICDENDFCLFFFLDQNFRKGLCNYLKKFSYKNASTGLRITVLWLSCDLSNLLYKVSFSEDLWSYLGEASGNPVADVMSTWTKQMGYPVLSVDGKQVSGHFFRGSRWIVGVDTLRLS